MQLRTFRPFLDTCLSTASRWVSLTVETETVPYFDENSTVDVVLGDIFERYHLDLPRLHTFRIAQSRADKDNHESSWKASMAGDGFVPSWNMPNFAHP